MQFDWLIDWLISLIIWLIMLITVLMHSCFAQTKLFEFHNLLFCDFDTLQIQ